MVDIDRNMMLTPDEYMAIMRLITSERESEGASLADRRSGEKPPGKKPVRTRKKNAYSKALSIALLEENKSQKKKNGDFKKGKSTATVLKAAHKKARRMTKK